MSEAGILLTDSGESSEHFDSGLNRSGQPDHAKAVRQCNRLDPSRAREHFFPLLSLQRSRVCRATIVGFLNRFFDRNFAVCYRPLQRYLEIFGRTVEE